MATAAASCDEKFPNGGRLFEPQSIEINNNVLKASRDFINGGFPDNLIYIGVKRRGSDFKFESSSVTVPYDIPWDGYEGPNCVMADNGNMLWGHWSCTAGGSYKPCFAICESF